MINSTSLKIFCQIQSNSQQKARRELVEPMGGNLRNGGRQSKGKELKQAMIGGFGIFINSLD